MRDTTFSIVVIRVNFFQNELMVEIHFKSLVRTIGKVLHMKFSWNTKVLTKWPLFVYKQLFWWSTSITLDITMMFWQTLSHFSHLMADYQLM